MSRYTKKYATREEYLRSRVEKYALADAAREQQLAVLKHHLRTAFLLAPHLKLEQVELLVRETYQELVRDSEEFEREYYAQIA